MRALLFVAAFLVGSGVSQAQDCPREKPDGPYVESASRTLVGRVVFHNDLRQWLSLEVDEPVCGERVIELFADGGGGGFEVDQRNSRELERFRGCRVKSMGTLGIPGTGYYSAHLFQNVEKIEPEAGCVRQPAFPDCSKAKPKQGVRSYRVSMWFDYMAPQGPVHATVMSGQQRLGPWQAYASYWLTGGFVFYAHCADDFTMSRLSGTRAAKPDATVMENWAELDPETAADKGVRRIRLSFTCRR
jgi:hypothetical protein